MTPTTQLPSGFRARFWGNSIGHLLMRVFAFGLLIGVCLVYVAFENYRSHAVSNMASAEGARISRLVFEHMYSVMRKGVTREEVDDLTHHIQSQLPNYQVSIVRGEPVARQFGERPGQAELRAADPNLAAAFSTGGEISVQSGNRLEYLYPMRVATECMACHTNSRPGEVNGVISVRVPVDALAQPLIDVAMPVMLIALTLIVLLLVGTFFVLRKRVAVPIDDLASHVADVSRQGTYEHNLPIGRSWPNEVRSLGESFNSLMTQVRLSHEQLRESSLRDPLTGLFNRRHFDASLSQMKVEAPFGTPPFAILMIDLDRFKPINDRYGHAAGDALLIAVGRALQQCIRESDIAVRMGGDEFAVLAIPTDNLEIAALTDRVRQAIEGITLRFGKDTIHPACSVGVAFYPKDGIHAEDLLKIADLCMYADKTARSQSR